MTTRIAILGFGEVARALAESLLARPDIRTVAIADRSGALHDDRGIDLIDVLRRKRESGSIHGDPARDARWVVENVDADIVVDLLPTDLKTAEPSLSLQEEAFRRGRHVVTAGKGPLALHGSRIRAAAAAAGCALGASGSVMGGAPAIELIQGAFAGDRILRLDGVLNGSTNLILSRLEEGDTWDEALRAARQAGALEADPSLDLLGIDAAAKVVILANLAWGRAWTVADVKADGIMGITSREAVEAHKSGFAIRLVVRASPEDGLGVRPVTLPKDHPLVAHDKENVLRLTLEGAGSIVLRGVGAGGKETASAVLGDVVRIGRSLPGAPDATTVGTGPAPVAPREALGRV